MRNVYLLKFSVDGERFLDSIWSTLPLAKQILEKTELIMVNTGLKYFIESWDLDPDIPDGA